MNELLERLKAAGVAIVPEFDVGVVRNGSEWFVGQNVAVGGHTLAIAWFGNWSKGTEERWDSGLNGAGSTKEIKSAITALLEAQRAEKERLWDENAKTNEAQFNTYSDRGHSGYLARKGIADLFGCRIAPNAHGNPVLVVPLRDIDGRIWNYQSIYDTKFGERGDKFFEKVSRINGCFHILETTCPLDECEAVYLAEGFATAAAVTYALRGSSDGVLKKRIVACAFNAGNLQSVAEAFALRIPRARLTLCADNDAFTVINGKPVNVGIEKGRRAAGAGGVEARLVWPVFKRPQKGFTDFQDLMAAEGLDMVLDQLLNHGKYVVGIQPMVPHVNAKGKAVPPSEKDICDYILKEFRGRLVRQDKNLFRYTGTHWVELDSVGEDKIKQMIGIAANHMFGIGAIINAYNYFFIHCPAVPPGVDLYRPTPYCANFANGTLHLAGFALKPHAPEDYLTTCLPYDCPDLVAPAPQAPMFDAYCARLWPDAAHCASVKELIFELMGSCLAPCHPNITFFIGRSNSGKSTLVKLMVKMVSLANTSQVQLCDMKGFALEAMVGKLVNFDTELDLEKPIADVMVKKITDRAPVHIDRKFKKQVSGYLPAVHFFAANDLPPTLDGRSKAYGRRIIAVRMDAPILGGTEKPGFENDLWDAEGGALVAKALDALRRLEQRRGAFTRPGGSAELVREMETRGDVVEQFFEDVKENDIQEPGGFLHESANLRIKRSVLAEIFVRWQESNAISSQKKVPAGEFFRRIKNRYNVVQPTHGGRFYQGIGMVQQPGESGIMQPPAVGPEAGAV